jgi:hypothetical protein
VGTSILKIELKIMSEERERPLIIRVRLLKRRRRKVKVDAKLGGQWKEKEEFICLVANGRRRRSFFTWWLMEGEGKGSFLPFPTFLPSNFT